MGIHIQGWKKYVQNSGNISERMSSGPELARRKDTLRDCQFVDIKRHIILFFK
jgi:hypothetical protein